jgi:hypothetical protein
MGIKQQDTDSTTAQLIHARHPLFTPAMLRGGIGCINSTEVVEHLGEYLEYAGNVKFWAIEMGTNDAWGGGDWNLNTYVSNMQTIIDSAKAHGITPVIARIIATDSSKAGWQVNPAFLEAVDKLTADNNLPAGPDFYGYFKEHPELLASDGVHPNGETKGGQAMHHLWAEALSPLYAVADTAKSDTTANKSDTTLALKTASKFIAPRIYAQGKNVVVEGNFLDAASVSIVSTTGQLVSRQRLSQNHGHALFENIPAGQYIAVIRSKNTVHTSTVRVK